MDERKYVYVEAQNGMTVRVPLDKLGEWRKGQEAQARGEKPVGSRETAEKLLEMFKSNYLELVKEAFKKHYHHICQILSKSDLVSNVEFEIIPIMVMFADYAAANLNADRREVFNAIVSASASTYPIYSNIGKLDSRTSLYGEIIRGKEPRAEWFPPDFLAKANNGLYDCIIALGDILVNPLCAENYDNAPVYIHGFMEVFSFSAEIMPQIAKELAGFFNEVCDTLERETASSTGKESSKSESVKPAATQPTPKSTPKIVDKRSKKGNKPKSGSIFKDLAIYFGFTIAAFFICASLSSRFNADSEHRENIHASVETEPTMSEAATIPKPKPQAEPVSGTILAGSTANCESEITITASYGSSHVVKLKNAAKQTKLSFYVRSGDTVTVSVPADLLYVYFASGDTWYGGKYLFGDETAYSMDDELLDFTQYSWKYTLYPVTNGNFSETPIDASEF